MQQDLGWVATLENGEEKEEDAEDRVDSCGDVDRITLPSFMNNPKEGKCDRYLQSNHNCEVSAKGGKNPLDSNLLDY